MPLRISEASYPGKRSPLDDDFGAAGIQHDRADALLALDLDDRDQGDGVRVDTGWTADLRPRPGGVELDVVERRLPEQDGECAVAAELPVDRLADPRAESGRMVDRVSLGVDLELNGGHRFPSFHFACFASARSAMSRAPAGSFRRAFSGGALTISFSEKPARS